MDSKRIKSHFVFTILIIISCCSLSSANYYRYIVPPDSVMAIEKASKLKPYLESDSDIAKIWGIIRLGQIGNENDIGRLVEIFENEPDQLGFMPPPRVKYYCLIAIGEIGGKKAEQAIMKIAEKSKRWIDASSCNISAGICDALGMIASTKAVKTLQSIRDGKSAFCDIVFSRKNLYIIELRKPEYETFQDSILYLLNIMERINSDRENRTRGDNLYDHRAAEIVLLEMLTPLNISIFKNIIENESFDYITNAFCDKIIELVKLRLRWHSGQYSRPDQVTGAIPAVLFNDDLDSLEILLDNYYNEKRSSIFYNVLLSEDADTSKFIDLLFRALTLESENPDTSALGWGNPTPRSISHIREYIMYLADNGANYIPQIESFVEKTLGDAGKWALISLGFLRHASIRKELQTIILNNPNPHLRWWAVRTLSGYEIRDDFEIFKKALSDTFYVHMRYDYSIDGKNLLEEDVYAVKHEAAGALRKMGYTVTIDSMRTFIIETGKK